MSEKTINKSDCKTNVFNNKGIYFLLFHFTSFSIWVKAENLKWLEERVLSLESCVSHESSCIWILCWCTDMFDDLPDQHSRTQILKYNVYGLRLLAKWNNWTCKLSGDTSHPQMTKHHITKSKEKWLQISLIHSKDDVIFDLESGFH
jgi:hypothetical protein